MENELLSKFKKANQQLEKGNVIAFGKDLINIYDILTCNCFFRDQKEVDYQQQLELLISSNCDENNFYVNLAKGFVYLRIEDKEEAYKYLTNAINLNSLCDVPYNLRAAINPEINPLYLHDAKTAVKLNPSVGNYFALANAYVRGTDENSIKKSIFYFGKAIKLKPDLVCAYSNRALQLEKSNDILGAVNNWIKCIEIDKNHWSYFDIWVNLDKLERYDEALKYIELGAKVHPNKISYQYALGIANLKINNLKSGIYSLKKYLEVYPNRDDILALVTAGKELIKTEILENANKALSDFNYKLAIAFFEEYIESEKVFNTDDIYNYFLSLLKNKNPEISIDESNLFYQRLDALKNSIAEKVENGKILTYDETNANKLIEYYSNYIIGFGVYEGDRISTIIDKDPHYIFWCIINLDHFCVYDTLFLNHKLKNEPLFLLALEHNLIKKLILKKWKSTENEYQNNYHHNYNNYDDDDDRDTFDALTDGQFGDYDDFEGDIDDVMTWLGK